MANGRSLHIGLNGVDASHYGGWDGTLNACEADARDMKALADARGFHSTLLLTKAATSKSVIAAIGDAAAALKSGDFFFLSYSGHGGQVPDTNGDETEDDMDETWVCYDRQVVDDELYALWGKFESGVRILVLSDSCHSGTVLKAALFGGTESPQTFGVKSVKAVRALPPAVQKRTYEAHKKLYDDIQAAHPEGERVSVGASVLLISGCQDSQTSQDGDKNGLFTGTLLKVWNRGFKGGYRKLHKAILKEMPPTQTPNLFRAGAISVAFERATPFTI
jgi:hypothetical protein